MPSSVATRYFPVPIKNACIFYGYPLSRRQEEGFFFADHRVMCVSKGADTPDLAAKGGGQAGAAEAVLPDGEADAGGRDVLRQVEVVAVKRMDGEDVAMGTVAGRGACAAVVVIAIVVAAVAGTGGQAVHSGVFREAAHVRREVDDVPVPKTGTGRGVGVVAGQGEALGAGGLAQCSSGERLAPPAPLWTCGSGRVSLLLKVGEVRVKGAVMAGSWVIEAGG